MALTVNYVPRYKGLSGSSPQIQDSGISDNGTYITLARTLNLTEETAPGTPGPGTAFIYVDIADSHLKIKDDGGNITDLNSAGGGGGAWGGITGTLSDQTDLQSALDAKGAAFTSSATLRSILGDETGTGAAVFATSPTLVTPVLGTPSSGTLTNCTGLPIAGGGTGQATAQAAIDALSAVSAATNEHVLTKDTASGNAIWKAQTGGAWTDSTTTLYLTTTTDDVVIGASSPVSSAKLSVDGDADQIQCLIQGHSTQTSNIFVVEKSDGTDLLAVSNTGGLTIGGTTNEIGSSTSSVPLSFTTAWCDKVVTLTPGATPALDASLGNIFTLAAVGDYTIAVPTNATSGQKIIIRHLASGGARTLALNTGAGGFRFGSDIPALSQTASGKYDYIGCVYNSTASFWDVISYVKGF